MYTIKFTGEFKRQMKLCERRGYDMEQLRTAILTLSTEGKAACRVSSPHASRRP